jgi:hypothetical protein
MPASITFTFLHAVLLLWTSFIQWGNSVPLRRADSCPGYKASNVQRSESSLTADLTLAGTACNLYSPDLQDLKFSAQWQTGMCWLSCSLRLAVLEDDPNAKRDHDDFLEYSTDNK